MPYGSIDHRLNWSSDLIPIIVLISWLWCNSLRSDQILNLSKVAWKYKVAENGNNQLKHKYLKTVQYLNKCTQLHSITGHVNVHFHFRFHVLVLNSDLRETFPPQQLNVNTNPARTWIILHSGAQISTRSKTSVWLETLSQSSISKHH